MNEKGISVISLVVTIIVIVLITSITLYNGIPIISNSNKTMAERRLKAISNAVLAYDKELGFSDIVGTSASPRLISSRDYDVMGLSDFANSENVPPTYIYKEIDGEFKYFHLYTYTSVKKNYLDEDKVTYSFVYQDDVIDSNLKVEFDEAKGVNRPLVTSDMQPVILSFNNKYYDVKTVTDIYYEDWYNYTSSSPMWANVMIQSSGDDMHNKYVYYVWIPRFAYKISYFDANTDYNNIPASSISIIFLRGNTDYMKNNEVLPSGYQVHPAFKFVMNGTEYNLPGFWVAKETVGGGASDITTAIEKCKIIHPQLDTSLVASHLIKNTEWAAVAYLSHSTVGNVADGSSLGEWNASGVFNLDSLQFVAAQLVETDGNGNPVSLPSNMNFADRYYYRRIIGSSGDVMELTYDSLERDSLKYGDAMLATSSGLSVNSAWFGGMSVKPTLPYDIYIMRGYDNNLFSYNAISSAPYSGGAYRNVLKVLTDGASM